MFLNVRRMGFFGVNRDYYAQLETPKIQDMVLSTTNKILTGKNYARLYCFYQRKGSISEDTCVSST